MVTAQGGVLGTEDIDAQLLSQRIRVGKAEEVGVCGGHEGQWWGDQNKVKVTQ
jgi:hypothetical protein